MTEGRRPYSSNETVEDKIRKYTQPHAIVTSHLRNNPNLLYRPNVSSNICRAPSVYNSHIALPSGPPLFPYSALDVCVKKIAMNQQHPVRNVVFKRSTAPSVNRKRSHSSSVRKTNQENLYGKRCHSSSSPTKSPDHILGNHTDNVFHQKDPDDIDSSYKYHQLTDEIEAYTCLHSQSKELLDKKLKLRSALLVMIRKQFPGVSLHLVGSSCNGFASDTSDADFCIMISYIRSIDQLYEARYYLQGIERLFHSMRSLKDIQLIQAKVPILKFEDTISGCECDINVNNSVGIRNTHLLRTYSKVDDRVRPLVMAAKRWGKARKINDASQGTLSSYSLVLMVLHYLQSGCNPPVLPSLQKSYPHLFKADSNVDNLPMFEAANTIACNDSDNTESVGELLMGFFRYFDETFPWDKKIMSVRLGYSFLKKDQLEFRNKFISIEEPFNLSNTARAVHELSQFVLIKEEFSRANTQLKEELSIENIL